MSTSDLELGLIPFKEKEEEAAEEAITTRTVKGSLSPWKHLRWRSGPLPGQEGLATPLKAMDLLNKC